MAERQPARRLVSLSGPLRAFEAAVAFVERWHPAVDADGDVSVLVSDADNGLEHCFTVNLDEGDASPCG